MFDDAKPLWGTRTFWVNLVGGAATIIAGLTEVLPAQYGVIALVVANLLTRLVTDQPAKLY